MLRPAKCIMRSFIPWSCSYYWSSSLGYESCYILDCTLDLDPYSWSISSLASLFYKSLYKHVSFTHKLGQEYTHNHMKEWIDSYTTIDPQSIITDSRVQITVHFVPFWYIDSYMVYTWADFGYFVFNALESWIIILKMLFFFKI